MGTRHLKKRILNAFQKDIKAWQFLTLYSFGMSHDSRSNGCHASKSEHFLYLMQSQLMAVSPLMKWSNCSKRAITEFIEYVVSAYLVKKNGIMILIM